MCCSFCLNRVCGKTRDAETNTYCSDTEELEVIITELQGKNDALEKYCAELEEEIEMLKAAHKDFVIDQTPSFTEPSPPPLTAPPVQLRPPDTSSLNSGDEERLKPPHTWSSDSGDDEKPPLTGCPDSSDEGSRQPPDTGSSNSGDDGSWSRRMRPAQRRTRSTARRRAAQSKLQPPMKKTESETAGTSAELPSRAPAGKKSVAVDKSRLRCQNKKEDEVQGQSPSPPCDALGRSDEEDQYEADDAVDTKAERLPTLTSTADIEDSGEGGGAVHCHHCEFACLGQGRLDRHVKRRHGHLGRNGRYKCDWCEYSTDHMSSMRRHCLTHTGDRPYRCDDCGKTFTQRSLLTGHSRAHTGQRPYVCDVCGSSLTTSSSLTRHKRIHTGEKVAECEQCGVTFNHISHYIVHMKYHNGVKEYRCQVCSAGFVTRAELTRHTRTHTGERPYVCCFCSVRFTRRSAMKVHVTRRHTQDYKHRCSRCGKKFPRPYELRKHETKCFSVR